MTAQLAPSPVFRSWNNLGLPLVGGKLFTYMAGTTAPQATYVDSTQTTPNTNPVILNFRGEAFVWLDPTLIYKFVLQDFLGNLIWTEDNIPGGFGASGFSISLIPNPTNTYSLGDSTHSWTNVYLGPNAAPAFDPVSGNIGYYARTAAEIAAAVTPTSLVYQPGDVRRYGADPSGTSDSTTAIQNAINQHNQGGPQVLLYPGTYKTNTSLNMGNQTSIPSGLIMQGVGFPVITCSNLTVPIITLGGTFMRLSGFKIQYNSLPTNTQTNAVGIRCYNLAWARLDRIFISNVYGFIDQYQGSVAGTGVNFFFSNWVSACVFTTFSGWGISLLPFNGGNSGNVFTNIYLNNNVNGTPSADDPCFGAITLSTNNDSFWHQINLEWCKNSQSLITMIACGNISFNALHFEGNYPATAFTGLIDVIEGGGGIGGTPTFNGVTVAGNDWTGLGGANQGALFRSDFNGNGNRIIVRGIDSHNNTTPANMTAFANIGSTCYGSTVEFENVADLDGSLSTDAYTPKASFGTVTPGVEIPLVRWNLMMRKQSSLVTDNAGGTATAVFTMIGTSPNGTDSDAMGLWIAASSVFRVKQNGDYMCSVTIPTGASPIVVVQKNFSNVATLTVVPGAATQVYRLALNRGDLIGFVLSSGSYTRTGVTFGISLAS